LFAKCQTECRKANSVKRCKLSNNFKGRDVVGTSRVMSTGYFGRLIANITTGIVSKQVTESGLRLTRKQLDSKHDPDIFWSDTVLQRFQDRQFKPSAFVPLIYLQTFWNPEALDFSTVPDRELSASYLRKSIHELRGEISKCYSRWSRSGQNDPENFPDFASCCDCSAMACTDSLECLGYWGLVNLIVSNRGIYSS
jgi:hypothetical protein